MPLRPYKFVVTAVVQDVDEDGQVVGEPVAEPVTLYGVNALAKYAADFTEQLASAADQAR